MAQRVSEKERKRMALQRRRKLALYILAGMCVYLVIISASLRLKLREQQKELAFINEQIEIALLENDELRRVLAGSQEECMERIAREKMGYAAVGERVYEDISGTG